MSVREHQCVGGEWSTEETWWAKDAQGIEFLTPLASEGAGDPELCRVCEKCEHEKLSRYRPEILTGYTQADVDEAIEEES